MLKKSDLNKEIDLLVYSDYTTQHIKDNNEKSLYIGEIDNKRFGIIFFHFLQDIDGEFFINIFTSYTNYPRFKSSLLKNFKGLIFYKIYKPDSLLKDRDVISIERLDFAKIKRIEILKDLFGVYIKIFFNSEDCDRITRLIFDNLIDSSIYHDKVFMSISLEYKE